MVRTKTVNFKTILREEIKETKKPLNNKEILQVIIPKSAKKLEPYFDDKRQICSILQRIFKKYNSRDIRRYCPEEYKRKYHKSSQEIDLLREYLKTIQLVFDDVAEITNSLKNTPTTQKNLESISEILTNT